MMEQMPSKLHDLEARARAVLETLVAKGSVWADSGLGLGSVALDSTAKSLERTARKLDAVREQLRHRDAVVEQPVVEEPVVEA